MFGWLAPILLMIVPCSDIPSDRVDVIELNHFFDPQGKYVFSQWIFWEWNRHNSRHDVVDWAMCRSDTVAIRTRLDVRLRAQVSATRDGWRLILLHNGFWREVKSSAFRETQSQCDREVEQRAVLPKERRRGLSAHLQRRPGLPSASLP